MFASVLDVVSTFILYVITVQMTLQPIYIWWPWYAWR